MNSDPLAPPRPSTFTAVAIMVLVSGVLNLIAAMSSLIWVLTVAVATFGLGCFLIVVPVYFLVLGIFEVKLATRLMPDPPTIREIPQHVPIMEILCILFCNPVPPVVGILTLILSKDEQFQAYLRQMR